MSSVPDDLDKLLVDVRKSIEDNRLFLKTLADDAADDSCESDEGEEVKEEEDFEEL